MQVTVRFCFVQFHLNLEGANPGSCLGLPTSLPLPPTTREEFRLDGYLEYPAKALYIYKHPCLLRDSNQIVVSLLNDRPNADNFSYSPVLQEWTKATDIRLRFLRTKTLLGHLMSVARQDPTVTRRYFYSIKDINIGGRCVCHGFAESCDLTDPQDPYKLLCRCQHNTCGPQCEQCCPGFQQKKWRHAIIDNPFVCEPCNCFGHSDECEYSEEIDRERRSLDIHGHYEGGGVCQNCRHNTMGINCNQCKPTFFRPYGKLLNATDVCQLSVCNKTAGDEVFCSDLQNIPAETVLKNNSVPVTTPSCQVRSTNQDTLSQAGPPTSGYINKLDMGWRNASRSISQ
ncbi:laminin subunit alpha [Trichonephila clavipes]|nr:laminin subunit alpha [Trichonephila clavipes]